MTNLPRKSDINVYDTLDERSAVRSFYGKSCEEIYQDLLTGYQHLQEDLSFMGPVAFAYYAPAWERLFDTFREAEKAGIVARWTKCIITCRCFDLEHETQESMAALRRMLASCEAFYRSEAFRTYCSADDCPEDWESVQEECAKLHALLYPAT